jgi:hypothetical protein
LEEVTMRRSAAKLKSSAWLGIANAYTCVWHAKSQTGL